MKLTAIIATRGRPAKALAAIEALQLTASGQHDLEIVVACDDDDPADTAGFFQAYGAPVRVDVAPRPAGVGECWNRVASTVDADLMLLMGDDAVITTPLWDQVIVEFFDRYPWPHPEIAVAALHDAASPGEATLFVMRPSWARHCGLLDTRFVFWFSDTALAETYAFISGQQIPFVDVAVASPGHGFNPRMRDMKLWWALFAATRAERLRTAADVRSRLGIPTPANLDALREIFELRDARSCRDSLTIVQAMHNRREPDENYLAARDAALAYLEREGWQRRDDWLET